MYSRESIDLPYLRVLEDIRNCRFLSQGQIVYIMGLKHYDFYQIIIELNMALEYLITNTKEKLPELDKCNDSIHNL